MREAQHRETGGGEHLILVPVTCLLGGSPVVPQTIRFDYEFQFWPQEVSSESMQLDLRPRLPKPGSARDWQKKAF
jgi:hypothetical protein